MRRSSEAVRRVRRCFAPILTICVTALALGTALLVVGWHEAPRGFVVVKVGAVLTVISAVLLLAGSWRFYQTLMAVVRSSGNDFRDPRLEAFESRIRMRKAIRSNRDVSVSDRASVDALLERELRSPVGLVLAAALMLYLSGRMVTSASSQDTSTGQVVLACAGAAVLAIVVHLLWYQWRVRRWQRRHLSRQAASD